MSGRRGRSARGYVLELVFVLGLVGLIYLWMTNGGPGAFGEWFAGLMPTP